MFDLSGRVALVTGGSRGIGRGVARALAERGAFVVVNYRSAEAEAQSIVKEIEEAGGKAEAAQFDVADSEACFEAVRAIAKRHGALDILVNNAGIALDSLLMRVSAEQLDKTMSVNVGGALFASKAAIRPMMKAKRGRIINMSSVVAESGNAGQAVYSSSKAALIGLTKSLAREYASRGITVNAVAPGFIATDMTATLSDDIKDAMVSQVPLKRVGTVEDIAAAVVYLASDEASYVTGQVLRVNGGMYV